MRAPQRPRCHAAFTTGSWRSRMQGVMMSAPSGIRALPFPRYTRSVTRTYVAVVVVQIVVLAALWLLSRYFAA